MVSSVGLELVEVMKDVGRVRHRVNQSIIACISNDLWRNRPANACSSFSQISDLEDIGTGPLVF